MPSDDHAPCSVYRHNCSLASPRACPCFAFPILLPCNFQLPSKSAWAKGPPANTSTAPSPRPQSPAPSVAPERPAQASSSMRPGHYGLPPSNPRTPATAPPARRSASASAPRPAAPRAPPIASTSRSQGAGLPPPLQPAPPQRSVSRAEESPSTGAAGRLLRRLARSKPDAGASSSSQGKRG